MNIKSLCHVIELDPVTTDIVLRNHARIDFSSLSDHIDGLKSRSTWKDAYGELQDEIGNDPDGMKMLTVLLNCVLATHVIYVEKGIPDRIFVDTMKFFSRFVNFDTSIYQRPTFHWGWWSPRQISILEFRIGALEYEMVDEGNEKFISLHIPAGADLSLPSLRQSYLDARTFFKNYFPDYANSPMHCNTWMLAPILKKLLPTTSRLISFQNSFVVNKLDIESKGFMKWIYGREDIPNESLQETTMLQKSIKAHLLAGGKISWAFGTLIDDPFRSDMPTAVDA